MTNQRYIVQSLEDFTFLFPDPSGDVGYCERLDHAGLFESFDEAIECASVFIGTNFIVFPFYK